MSRFGAKDTSALKSRASKLRGVIRDVIYTSKQNMYELYRTHMTGKTLDCEGFQRLVADVSGNSLDADEVMLVFKSLNRNRDDKITFQTFEEAFRSEEPTSVEFETIVIRKVREWMFQNKLSSELAFDSLCRGAGRFVEKTLSRPQFHKAIMANDVGLSAIQIDSLFAALTPDAVSPLDIRGW